MPVLSRFHGIAIRMYFIQAEHNPPHIHAVYGSYTAEITIADGRILEGRLPSKARHLGQEWIERNRSDLFEIWESQQFRRIDPLA